MNYHRNKPNRAERGGEFHADDVIYSPEIGERISTIEAVRERVRLHPMARTREILAMFELDGTPIDVSLIQQVKEEEFGTRAYGASRF